MSLVILSMLLIQGEDSPFRKGERITLTEPKLCCVEETFARPRTRGDHLKPFNVKLPSFVEQFFTGTDSNHFKLKDTSVTFWLYLAVPEVEEFRIGLSQIRELAIGAEKVRHDDSLTVILSDIWAGGWFWRDRSYERDGPEWEWDIYMFSEDLVLMRVVFTGKSTDLEDTETLRKKLLEVMSYLAWSAEFADDELQPSK